MNQELAALVVKRCLLNRITALEGRVRRIQIDLLAENLQGREKREQESILYASEIEIDLLTSTLRFIDRLIPESRPTRTRTRSAH